jgi:hypothetical protein
MNRLSDTQIATVLGITVESGFSRHLSINIRYCLFLDVSVQLHVDNHELQSLAPTTFRMLRSNIERRARLGKRD